MKVNINLAASSQSVLKFESQFETRAILLLNYSFLALSVFL